MKKVQIDYRELIDRTASDIERHATEVLKSALRIRKFNERARVRPGNSLFVDSLKDNVWHVERVLRDIQSDLNDIKSFVEAFDDLSPVLNRPIDDIEMSERVYTLLKSEDYRHLGDIAKHYPDKYPKGFGGKTRAELKFILQEHGLVDIDGRQKVTIK